MGAKSCDVRGLRAILDRYDLSPSDWHFSVWQGRDMKFSSLESDEDGRSLLEHQLRALELAGVIGLYTLKFHKETDKDGFLSEKTPVCGSFNFKVCEQTYDNMSGIGSMQIMPAVDMRLNAIESKLNAMLEQGAENEPETDNEATLGSIERILSNPLTGQLVGIIAGFFATKSEPVGAISGIDATNEDIIIANAIKRLRKVDPEFHLHIAKLADMAEKNTSKYKMALSFL